MALIENFEKREFTQLLDGDVWLMAQDGEGEGHEVEWQNVTVPGCWEQYNTDRLTEGPFLFKRTFFAPETPHGARWTLEFDAVNYFCEIYVNGRKVGEHEGGWSGFSIDVHDDIAEFGDNELLIKVWKQGDRQSRFPAEEHASDFLPCIGIIFGGIWKSVRLVPVYAARIENVHIKPDAENERVEFSVKLSGDLIRDVQLDITVCSPHGDVRFTKSRDVNGRDVINDIIPVDDCVLWDTDNPHLYRAAMRLFINGRLIDKYEQRFGIRTFKADGNRLLLNGRELHLRGVLHWGWNSERIIPVLTRDEIRTELEALRRQGFNLVKHCSYIPNKEYYEIADEMGFLVWQELMVWLPVINEEFVQRILRQYEGIYREIRNHPSIVLWTLGSGLEKSCSPAYLEKIYQHAKLHTNNALICDISGGAGHEAYGKDLADFYDYHFYADAQFFPELLAGFAGIWRSEKPWLFGEFCDYDTTRNIEQYLASQNGNVPWWLQEDGMINPTLDNPYSNYAAQQRLMQDLSLPFTGAQIYENGVRSAYEYRKLILEQVRAQKNINGYVIASIRHTPLTTSSLFDDNGLPKHRDEDIRSINDDIVLFATWDSCRDWINGGDRIVRGDSWNYYGGDMLRPHIMLSNKSRKDIETPLSWRLEYENGEVLRSGTESCVPVAAGKNSELHVLEIFVPDVLQPRRVVLKCSIAAGEKTIRNQWVFTVYPRPEADAFDAVTVFDPGGYLTGLEKVLPDNDNKPDFLTDTPGNSDQSVIITTFLTGEIISWAERGGKVIYIQCGAGYYPVLYKPFWRESVQIFRTHGLMDVFPHCQHTGTAFYSLATDCVFDGGQLPNDAVRIMDRLDARQFELDCYMFEETAGDGKIVATTLRFGGGHGAQASAVNHNPAAVFWLAEIIKYIKQADTL